MVTVAVVNQKGGVGKTTVAVNLAAAAHLEGRTTLVLDLDKQGTAFEWYAARREGSSLAELVTRKADRPLSVPQLRGIIGKADFVVLDGPPRLNEMTVTAAVAAEIVVIPVRPSPPDIWATSDTLSALDEADAVRARFGWKPVRRILLVTQAKTGTVLAREASAALAEKGDVADVVIHDRIVFGESMYQGESVLTVTPQGPAAEEIRALYRLVSPTARRRKQKE